MDKPLRVLFFFECPSCKKRKGIYENGEEHISKPDLCPKCSKEIKITHSKKGEVITWITICSSCGFSETKVDDFEKDYKFIKNNIPKLNSESHFTVSVIFLTNFFIYIETSAIIQ